MTRPTGGSSSASSTRCLATARPPAAAARCCSVTSATSTTAAAASATTALHPPERFDGTLAAQKALSAVYRTGQQFGAAYLIDVLTGHVNERIERNGHHTLKTFGVGSDLDKASWHSVLRQLIAAGLLSVDVAGPRQHPSR